MAHCPHATLLDILNFEQGTPRQEIARLRKTGQRLIWQTDEYANGGHWLVMQRDDIDTVLKKPADFTNNFGPLLEDFPPEALAVQQQSMTFMDPPIHRDYRSLVDIAFRPKALRERAPLIKAIAKGVIDNIIAQGSCEFVAEVAMQTPMQAIYTLLGVNTQDYQRVANLTNTMTLANDPDYAIDRDAGFAASIEAYQFGIELAEDHRRNPRDSVTMDLLKAEVDGRKLSNEEYAGFFVNLVIGGMETSRNTTAWLIYELIRHPKQYAALQANLELVPSAVEEILRLRNTVVYLRRTATRDMTFAEQPIKQGDKLICVLGSANRNEAYFDSPDTFNIMRDLAVTRRNYRTFGAGPHFCVGIHQARLILESITEEIARRMGNLQLLSEPEHFRSNFMDGFKKMHISFQSLD
jgi:cytochrome P450